MSLTTKQLLHEGENKIVYQGDNNDKVILAFKDNLKQIPNSGVLCNLINEQIFGMLSSCSVPNHFIRRTNLREQEVYNTSVFPFYVRITNVVTEPLHSLFDMETGTILKKPLLEFMAKQHGKKHTIEHTYLKMFDWCQDVHLEQIRDIALRVNDALQAYFYTFYAQVAHCYLRFGLFEPQYTFNMNGKEDVLLINDLSPTNFTLWCKQSNQMLPMSQNYITKLAEHMKINLDQFKAASMQQRELTNLQKEEKPT